MRHPALCRRERHRRQQKRPKPARDVHRQQSPHPHRITVPSAHLPHLVAAYAHRMRTRIRYAGRPASRSQSHIRHRVVRPTPAGRASAPGHTGTVISHNGILADHVPRIRRISASITVVPFLIPLLFLPKGAYLLPNQRPASPAGRKRSSTAAHCAEPAPATAFPASGPSRSLPCRGDPVGLRLRPSPPPGAARLRHCSRSSSTMTLLPQPLQRGIDLAEAFPPEVSRRLRPPVRRNLVPTHRPENSSQPRTASAVVVRTAASVADIDHVCKICIC